MRKFVVYAFVIKLSSHYSPIGAMAYRLLKLTPKKTINLRFIQPVNGGFPHKWPIMQKASPCHDATMLPSHLIIGDIAIISTKSYKIFPNRCHPRRIYLPDWIGIYVWFPITDQAIKVKTICVKKYSAKSIDLEELYRVNLETLWVLLVRLYLEISG